MSSWYYSDKGTRVGPVDSESIRQLVETRAIDEQTLLWNSEAGGDWKPYNEFSELRRTESPPPLPGMSVSDLWVWMMVAVPLVAGFVELTIRESQGVESIGAGVFTLYFIPYMILASLDQRAISKSGRKDQAGGIFWWILIIPVYLFKRSKRLRKSQLVFWSWIAAFLAGAFITEGLASSSGMYFGAGIPPCGSSASKSQVEIIFPQLFNNAAGGNVIAIDNINETSVTDTRRSCQGTVLAADGNEYPISYTIESRGDQFYYELMMR